MCAHTFHCFTLIKYFRFILWSVRPCYVLTSARRKSKMLIRICRLLTSEFFIRGGVLFWFRRESHELDPSAICSLAVAIFFFCFNLKEIYGEQFPQTRFIEPASAITIGTIMFFDCVVSRQPAQIFFVFHWHSISKTVFYIVLASSRSESVDLFHNALEALFPNQSVLRW